MGAHRRQHERLETHRLEGVDRRPGHDGDPRDSPAADPYGDGASRRNPLADPTLENQAADRTRNILHPGLRNRLTYAGQGGKIHCDLTFENVGNDTARGLELEDRPSRFTVKGTSIPGQFA